MERQWFDEDCACECAEKGGKREAEQAQECSDRTVTFVGYFTKTESATYTYTKTYSHRQWGTYTITASGTTTVTATATKTATDKPFQWVSDHCECECGGDENAAAAECASDYMHPVWSHDNCQCNCADKDGKDEATQKSECEEQRTDDQNKVVWDNHNWFHEDCACRCKDVGGKSVSEQRELCNANVDQLWLSDICECRCAETPTTERKKANCLSGDHPGTWNSPDNPCKCSCPYPLEYDSRTQRCKCSLTAKNDCAARIKGGNRNWEWNDTTCNCDCTLKAEECYVGGKPGKITDDCRCVCADAGKQRTGTRDKCLNTPVYEVQDDCTEKCAIANGTACLYDCSDLDHPVYGVWSDCKCVCKTGASCWWAVAEGRTDCSGTLDEYCNCRCDLTASDCASADPAKPHLAECDCMCECNLKKAGAKIEGGKVTCSDNCHKWNSSTCNCDDRTQVWKDNKKQVVDELKALIKEAEELRDGAAADLTWYAKFGDIDGNSSCDSAWGSGKNRIRNINAYVGQVAGLFGLEDDGTTCPGRSPCPNGKEKMLQAANDTLSECIKGMYEDLAAIESTPPCDDIPGYRTCDEEMDNVCAIGVAAYDDATGIYLRQHTIVTTCPCEYDAYGVEVSCYSWGDYDPHRLNHIAFPDPHVPSGLDGKCDSSASASAASFLHPRVSVEVRYGS